MRLAIVVLALGAFLVPCYAESPKADKEPVKADKDPVKAIDVKDLKLTANEGRFGDPTVIKSEEDLGKTVKDKDTIAKLLKAVDFKTQQILIFAWSGSGGDKLNHKTGGDKKVEIMFSYTPGLTRDLRPHNHIFVVPKEATWKVDSGK